MKRTLFLLIPLALAAGLFVFWTVPLAPARAESSVGSLHTAASAPIHPAGDPVSAVPHPILGDINVRRAIAYCTDKEGLVAAAYPDLTPAERAELIIDSFVMPSSWAYSPPTTTYPYSPTQGMALLDTAGWTQAVSDTYRMKDGRELALVLKTTDIALRVALISEYASQLAECGIHLIPRHLPPTYWFGSTTGLHRRDFSVTEFAWVGSVDDPGGYEFYACDRIPSPANGWDGDYLNRMGWCNQAAHTALVSATNTTLPQDERKMYYAQVNEYLAQDVPTIPLFLRDGYVDIWEHFDFNLEMFSSWIKIISDTTNVLNTTDYKGNDGWIIIPPGALITPTEVNDLFYSPLQDPGAPLTDSLREVIAFRLTMYVTGVPQDTYQFNTPITLTVPYSLSSLLGAVEETLNLYFWDGQAWQDASDSCPEGERYELLDLQNQFYYARVCHLSEFALAGDRLNLTFIPMVVR